MRQYQSILESQETQEEQKKKSYPYHISYGRWGLRRQTYEINSPSLVRLFQKPQGKYEVVSFAPQNKSFAQWNYAVNAFSLIIKRFLGSCNEHTRVLVVALGNRDLVADSLGYHTLKHVFITANLKENPLFSKKPSILGFETGVQGWTGVQSSDVLAALVKKIKPDKIIVIDTLCAKHYTRLGTSFQFNNGGIVPGEGIGQAKKPIVAGLTNTVLSIGVPLVIYAKDLFGNVCREVRTKPQENVPAEQLKKADCNLIVTPTDIETQVELCGKLLGYAINRALLGIDVEQQQTLFGWLHV